ncbi:MAG: carboxymuconolactone decarboxylase family protein [Acidimicrobiales bacterium]
MTADRKALFRSWPEGYHALAGLHRRVCDTGLEPPLLELVRLRASQLNGCAYCVDKHTKDARAAGESEQRLYGLSAWEEAPYYSERERAALALTEAVTFVSDHRRLDDAVSKASKQFAPEELTHLLYATIEINAWNRLAVATGAPEPGSYEVAPDPTS